MATQVNVMTHAIKARKERGAKIVVVDVYRNDTMKPNVSITSVPMPMIMRTVEIASGVCVVSPFTKPPSRDTGTTRCR